MFSDQLTAGHDSSPLAPPREITGNRHGVEPGLFIIGGSLLLVAILVSSFEIFPANDDWAFQHWVKDVLEGHRPRSYPLVTSFVFQGLWGLLFGSFGFSHKSMVYSTLTASFIGLYSFYRLLKLLGVQEVVSVFLTLLVLFNPYYLTLSVTFMTDVHYLAWLLLSLLLYSLGLRRERSSISFLGSVSASFAFLVRQPGILVPASFLFVELFKGIKERQPWNLCLKRFGAIVGAPLLTVVLWVSYHPETGDQASQYLVYQQLIAANASDLSLLLANLKYKGMKILLFLGFSTIPLLPLRRFKRNSVSLYVLAIFLITFVSMRVNVLPGPLAEWTTGNYYISVHEARQPALSTTVVWVVGVVTILSAAAFVMDIFASLRERSYSIASILLTGVGQFAFAVGLSAAAFTRYFLPILPFGLLITARSLSNTARWTKPAEMSALAGLCLLSIFSLAQAQDLLAWNQARWRLGKALVQEVNDLTKIEGGFEWDNWFLYQYAKEHPEKRLPREKDAPWWLIDWVPVLDPLYVLANMPSLTRGFTGRYTPIRSLTYYSWLYRADVPIYALRREESRPSPRTLGSPFIEKQPPRNAESPHL